MMSASYRARGAGMARIKVSVERVGGWCNLPVMVGDCFHLDGSKLSVPDGTFVCMWALQSMMPVFPILDVQDSLAPAHWVHAVRHFTCSDPKARVVFLLERMADDSD
jgi:carbon-monoxide dehydrogenase iron sulfur subunit